MINRHFCFALFGLGLVLSTSITGCPSKDAVLEPLADVPAVCAFDSECEDGNVCTKNSCDDKMFVCVVSQLDGVPTPMASPSECVEHVCKMGVDTAVPVALGVAVAKQVDGNCKKTVCDGNGGKIEANDDEDVHIDGSDCTLDICTDGVPSNPNVPADMPCGSNMNLTCDGEGQCRGCVTDSDCSVGMMACASTVCNAGGVCEVLVKPNGMPLPAQNQTAGDCSVRVCDGAGNAIDVADPSDPASDGNECTADTCNGTTPVSSPMQAGATCNGNGVCDGAGHCFGVIGASCATDGECSSGHCVDAVCCDTACTGQCVSCNAAGSIGTCTNIPFPETDATCSGTKVCDGYGSCELANGQSCNPAKKCASGTCYQGKCKSTTGQPCFTNADCFSAVCIGGVCD